MKIFHKKIFSFAFWIVTIPFFPTTSAHAYRYDAEYIGYLRFNTVKIAVWNRYNHFHLNEKFYPYLRNRSHTTTATWEMKEKSCVFCKTKGKNTINSQMTSHKNDYCHWLYSIGNAHSSIPTTFKWFDFCQLSIWGTAHNQSIFSMKRLWRRMRNDC